MPDETRGPFLAMAVLCEMAMQEANGVLSIIRVMERIQVNGPTPEMKAVPVKLSIVVVLRSGFYKGKASVAIKPIPPSNQEMKPIEASVLLEGDDRGANVIVNAPDFPISEEGLYWFDVSVNGALFTRIPLRVLYQRVGPSPGPGQSKPTPPGGPAE